MASMISLCSTPTPSQTIFPRPKGSHNIRERLQFIAYYLILRTSTLDSVVGGRAFLTCSANRYSASEGSFAQMCRFSLIRSLVFFT